VSIVVQDDHRWWWRIALPGGVLLLVLFWWIAGIGEVQEEKGHSLFGLFASANSTAAGDVLWAPHNRRQAFMTVELPYYVGIALLLGGAAVGSIGVRRTAGWIGVLGIWGFNLFCALLLTTLFSWLWINVVGVFI
jgi:hypothetical protein